MADQLTKLGFGDDVPVATPRIIMTVDADEGCGKTHLSLTAPRPIAFFDIDDNVDPIVKKFNFKKGEFRHYQVGYLLEDGDDEAYKKTEAMIKAYKACLAAPDSVVRSIVFDTGTEFWEMVRLARFGKINNVKPHHYGPVNAEFRTLIRHAKRNNKNLILVHKRKDEYINTNPKKKDAMAIPTGKRIRAGFKEMGYLVQVAVELTKDKDNFYCRIDKCTQDPNLEGEVLETDRETGEGMISFPWIASMVMGNDPEDWK
jgi:hypothetical protein